MNEAEKLMTHETGCYYDYLQEGIGRDVGIDLRVDGNTGFSGYIAHATAAQRAEAFLRTLSLWEETK